MTSAAVLRPRLGPATWRNGHITQAGVIARDLGMQPSFSPTRMPALMAGPAAGAPAIAVLGRWPVAVARRHVLPRPRRGRRYGRPLRHLGSSIGAAACHHGRPGLGAGSRSRPRSAVAGARRARPRRPAPVIAAVMNASPGDRRVRRAGAVVADTRATAGPEGRGSVIIPAGHHVHAPRRSVRDRAGRILIRPGVYRGSRSWCTRRGWPAWPMGRTRITARQ